MIIVYHKANKVLKVSRNQGDLSFLSDTIAAVLVDLTQSYPNDWLIWCTIELESFLNLNQFKNIFHHHKIMASFTSTTQNYIPNAIGYVEESPFIKINKKVKYPSWLMSSEVGGIHASVLNIMGSKIKPEANFDYFLNSVAKLGMLAGLFCYSEPCLLINTTQDVKEIKTTNHFVFFRFVKQHYKKRWLLLLFFNLLLFEKRFPLLPLCYSLFFKSRKKTHFNLDTISVQSSLKTIDKKTIDVIIPTIGRKEYLYDVLQDLAGQTHLPEKVIIVEQNPIEDSVSELDYLQNEKWPFFIKHIFTHQAGACNARNLALEQVESEWVFLADDDIRIEKDFNTKMLEIINEIGVEVVSVCCIQKEEKPKFKTVFQWASFGSGCSFVKGEVIKKCKFNLGYEFGYGEDVDFGMQLRNLGHDIVYLPEPQILHLKAPIGGFRTKPVLQWQNDAIQPKPSPTVMLSHLLHKTKEQVLGYKTILFFKYYKHQKIKNPIRYFFCFRKQWNQSVLWANQLKNKKE